MVSIYLISFSQTFTTGVHKLSQLYKAYLKYTMLHYPIIFHDMIPLYLIPVLMWPK